LNEIRRELGLTPLFANPAADTVVEELARTDTWDDPPLSLWYTPRCAVCDVVSGRDPRALYAERGGRGAVELAIWRAGWRAAQNLSVFHQASALVLDPRARTFSAATTPKGMLVIAVSFDPRAAFARPVRWPPGHLDPRRQLWASVLLPPGTKGEARLIDRRQGKTLTIARPLDEERGRGGSRLVALGFNSQLGFARPYRLRVGRLELPLATRSIPRSFLRRSWSFRSMPPSQRRAFRAVFRGRAPLLRRIANELDGAVTVVGGGRGCGADACVKPTRTGELLGVTSVRTFWVLHELGHVVWALGLDQPGRDVFAETIERRWHCTGSGCVAIEEIFADQLAYWALGVRPRGVDDYGDPVLIPRAVFGRMLAREYAYRPRPALGPIPT
jgi:hypothetical protein